MRIRTLTAVNSRSEFGEYIKIQFGKAKQTNNNFFSILIGENGTRKSQSLRDILDLSFSSISRLKDSGRTVEGKSGTLIYWGSVAPGHRLSPKKIIAVSGVATDRFPSRLTSRIRKPDRGDLYRYMGPRSESNLVSRSQSLHEIARVLIVNWEKVTARLRGLLAAFELLPLSKGVLFKFDRVENNRATRWTTDSLLSYLEKTETSKYRRFSSAESSLQKECLRIMNSKAPLELRLDLDDLDPTGITDGLSPEGLGLALDCGAVSIAEPYLLTKSGGEFLLSDFSSGQWHIFSSLFFTALAVEDDTLILIDEPENSLHPQWQREYLRLFEKTISSCKGVHAVVATHSPLIASSLPPDRAEVIRLIRNRLGNVVASEVESGPFGWTAEDILEKVFGLKSTRSELFTEQMDGALKLFARGDRKSQELKDSLNRLKELVDSLPEDDVARTVIETMRLVIFPKQKNTKAAKR